MRWPEKHFSTVMLQKGQRTSCVKYELTVLKSFVRYIFTANNRWTVREREYQQLKT